MHPCTRWSLLEYQCTGNSRLVASGSQGADRSLCCVVWCPVRVEIGKPGGKGALPGMCGAAAFPLAMVKSLMLKEESTPSSAISSGLVGWSLRADTDGAWPGLACVGPRRSTSSMVAMLESAESQVVQCDFSF